MISYSYFIHQQTNRHSHPSLADLKYQKTLCLLKQAKLMLTFPCRCISEGNERKQASRT